MLASAWASGRGAWGLDLGSGHRGLSLVSRGCRHVCVGASALGNSVFRVVCMCMGVGLRHAFHYFGLVGPPRSGRRSPGPVGSFSVLPGSLWSCCQVLYLVLRVRARALIRF